MAQHTQTAFRTEFLLLKNFKGWKWFMNQKVNNVVPRVFFLSSSAKLGKSLKSKTLSSTRHIFTGGGKLRLTVSSLFIKRKDF